MLSILFSLGFYLKCNFLFVSLCCNYFCCLFFTARKIKQIVTIKFKIIIMGCHTWYKKLVTNDQEKILKKINDILSMSKYYNWYTFGYLVDLFVSDDELLEYVLDEIDIIKVNGIYGIYEDADNYQIDEPRIGGYPETIITSAKEMFEAMENGLIGISGRHYNFYWDSSRDKEIRKNIIDFLKHILMG